MIKEWQIVEAQRDATHAFLPVSGSEFCRVCQRRRWNHVDDGHRTFPEHKYSMADTKFRPGPHPYWTRPGSFNSKPRKVRDLDTSISHRPEVPVGVSSCLETRNIPAGMPGPTREGMGNPSPRKNI